MDDKEFQALLAAEAASQPQAAQPQAATPEPVTAQPTPQAPASGQPSMTPEQQAFDAQLPADLKAPRKDAIGKPSDFLDAAAAGPVRAGLEVKDFALGEPEVKGEARQQFDKTSKAADDGGLLNPVVSTISQFATGMLGAGKILQGARLVSGGVDAAVGAVEATRKGAYALQSARAAGVGAVAFDPHQERLSNLLEEVPVIGPSVFGWLAANPEDTAWEGRTKAALESIGLDAVLGGVFLASAKLLKAIRNGSHEGVEAATRELEAAEGARGSQDAAVGQVGDEVAQPSATPEASPAAIPERPTSMPMAQEGDEVLELTERVPGQEPILDLTVKAPGLKPAVIVTPEDAESLVASTRADIDAFDAGGYREGALDAGHVFGQGAKVPWAKLNLPQDVDDFVARVADSIEGQVNTLKGGAVLSDARVQKQLQGIASYFNIEPSTIVGRIQESGQAASRMVADMEAAYLISNRMHTEAFNLAARISLGDFAGLPSREAAMGEFQRQVTLAGSMLASGQSMRAAMGRGMRRLRPEFAIDPELVEQVQALGGEKLLKLFNQTDGDPLKLKLATNKTFLRKAADEVGFLIQNNLLWNYGTHIVNLLSNAYMLAGRPAERIVGGLLKGDTALSREALQQYAYYPAALVGGFRSAVQTFRMGESILDPRHTPFIMESKAAVLRDGALKPWNSLSGVMHNAYLGVALPTRILTASDEMMKQTVYASVVQSKAWAEGVSEGLTGKDLKQFVRERLTTSFDEGGRAINKEAIEEARIATFSQDLTPTGWGDIPTAGKTVRNAVSSNPMFRLILPFTQTPTNIFRYTVKMTPGFNLMQQEYAHMLAGKMGEVAQAQAIGQMAMGSLALGAIAVSGLNITGGGPQDPKLKAELMATGWRPYSVVWQNDDGSRAFFPIGRVDPIALPFGIVADIQDYMHAAGEEGASRAQGAVSALFHSLIKQVSNKTYMTGIARAMDAFQDPKQHLNKFLAGTTMELVPFSSALRTYNPDPYMREARSYVDNLMASAPGLSEMLPARYNALGEPVRDRTDFISTSPKDLVTAEEQRMASLGRGMVPPSPSMDQADLRDITMKDGRNAWETYQQLAGKPTARTQPLRGLLEKVMQSSAYKKAPDGDIGVPGTKMWILHGPISQYRQAAKGVLMRDENVREALLAAKRKVAGAYATANAPGKPPPEAKAGMEALQGIGQAFGFNLGGQ